MKTGKLPLDPKAWLAIMSLSLIVNLPGLAVSPMLGTLSHIFPETTELEKQLLTMLPNLLIIPFVLMSGKLSTTPYKKRLIILALLIFAGSVVGYMLSQSMLALIIFSCTLGIGAGILVPFSTGLLSDTFAGQPLMRQMGLQSAVSNLTLVFATFAVGWLAHYDWHMPFLVYGVCIIPLLMTPFLNRVPKEEMDPELSDKTDVTNVPDEPVSFKCNKSGIDTMRLVGLFVSYFLMTFGTISLSEYIPFLVDSRHFDAGITGTLTSVYFLAVFASGFWLTKTVNLLRYNTILICAACVLIGMCLVAFFPSIWMTGAGILITGLGYGSLQPLFYNKATKTVCRPSLSTKALSIILTANYSAIVVEPLITQGLCKMMHQNLAGVFPFYISVFVCGFFLIYAFATRNTFLGSIDKSYFTKQ